MFNRSHVTEGDISQKMDKLRELAIHIKHLQMQEERLINSEPLTSPMRLHTGQVVTVTNNGLFETLEVTRNMANDKRREMANVWLSLFADLGMTREWTLLSVADRLMKDYVEKK